MVELPNLWLGQNQTNLILAEQPASYVIVNQDIFMLAESLAPTLEMGTIALDFAFLSIARLKFINNPQR